MKVLYHLDFPKDIKRFEAQYVRISERSALVRIKSSPGSAGHFLNTGSKIVKEVRRSNLRSFHIFHSLWCLG